MSWSSALAGRVSGLDARIGFPEWEDARVSRAMRQLQDSSGIVPVAVSAREASGEFECLEISSPEIAQRLSGVYDGRPPDGHEALWGSLAAVRAGRLDGVVAGAVATTADVLRAGLRVAGTATEPGLVSSAFYMDLGERVLTFTDAAVVPNPTAEQIVAIAEAACQARPIVVGDEPRVAFLSYSTRGSAAGDSVERMRRACAEFGRRHPEVPCDGEIQADAALVPAIARRKAPGSPLDGSANILVFPGLDAGNISYKLVERLAGATAIGPILQGLALPLNDLSRGASTADIVTVARVTALQAAAYRSESLRETL